MRILALALSVVMSCHVMSELGRPQAQWSKSTKKMIEKSFPDVVDCFTTLLARTMEAEKPPSYKKKVIKKEKVEVIETEHPYPNNLDMTWTLGAISSLMSFLSASSPSSHLCFDRQNFRVQIRWKCLSTPVRDQSIPATTSTLNDIAETEYGERRSIQDVMVSHSVFISRSEGRKSNVT